MDMELTQELKMEQRQVISMRLQQALQMLALTGMELAERIEQELESNPALEIDQEDNEPVDGGGNRRQTSIEDIDWASYFDGNVGPTYIRETDQPYDPLRNQPAAKESLIEHLTRQLEVICDDEETFNIAMGIATALDNDGYLRLAVDELAGELDATAAEVERVLVNVVQELDPPGVGARDLRECLLIQWCTMSDPDALVGRIIEEALGDVGNKSPALVAADLGVDEADVVEALEVIRSFEPCPGRSFGASGNVPLIPDITVDLVDGEVQIRVEEDAGSRLYISPKYKNLLLDYKNLDSKTKKYLRDRIKAAAWFIRAVHKRRQTVRKVTKAIFEHQKDFIERGPAGLKPLTMEDVAGEVGVHVSTVSRATAGKIVDTRRGIYPLKYFFTGAISGDRGNVAVEKVKVFLRNIVAKEDPIAPLSDEALAKELARRGIYIARRTVAKYRKEMGIPPKHERRKFL